MARGMVCDFFRSIFYMICVFESAEKKELSLELKNLHSLITQRYLWVGQNSGISQSFCPKNPTQNLHLWVGFGGVFICQISTNGVFGDNLHLEHPKLSKQKPHLPHLLWEHLLLGPFWWVFGRWLVPRNAAKKLAMLGDTVPWWRFVGGFVWSLLVEGEGEKCWNSMEQWPVHPCLKVESFTSHYKDPYWPSSKIKCHVIGGFWRLLIWAVEITMNLVVFQIFLGGDESLLQKSKRISESLKHWLVWMS